MVDDEPIIVQLFIWVTSVISILKSFLICFLNLFGVFLNLSIEVPDGGNTNDRENDIAKIHIKTPPAPTIAQRERESKKEEEKCI